MPFWSSVVIFVENTKGHLPFSLNNRPSKLRQDVIICVALLELLCVLSELSTHLTTGNKVGLRCSQMFQVILCV